MRTCSEYKQLASACADGELNKLDEQDLQNHLAQCASCRTERDELAIIKELTEHCLTATRAPRRLRTQVRSDLEAESAATRTAHPLRGWLSWRYAPAAMVAAVLLVFFLRPNSIPLQALPNVPTLTPASEVFASSEAAARHLADETGLSIRPVALDSLGLTFVAAGRLRMGACQGGYLTFADQQGHLLTVFELCPKRGDLPAGNDLSRYGTTARAVETNSGCHVIYWPENGLVIAVCTSYPHQQAVNTTKVIAQQLQYN